MRKIDIAINTAKILSYEVKLNDDKPEISATIGLFAGDKQISYFSLRTESYYSNSIQFDLPVDIINPIKDVADKLEIILIKECNKSFALLEEPKK